MNWINWQLETKNNGRQLWSTSKKEFTAPELAEMEQTFTFDKSINANSADRVYRSKKEETHTTGKATEADVLNHAIAFYCRLQAESGHWPGDYGGPHFLTPGLVIASYITESPLPVAHRVLIKRYMLNHQNADGGWGLHIEDTSTMFGTVLQYVSLRLLGVGAEDVPVKKARQWIADNGGATAIPSWGKFYLSVLGVYEWDGCNSLFPEMWLMPKALHFHPSKYWCHARMVYLPMAYCYGLKIKGAATELTEQLKQEIYNEPYESIDWVKARNQCAQTDLYHRPSILLKVLNGLTNGYEKLKSKRLRKAATNHLLKFIQAEDEQTNYINIGPVNQAINSICVWHAQGKHSVSFQKHYERWFDYLWLAEDGMKMNGYNGSQFWDTAFATQALLESPFPHKPAVRHALHKAYQFIDISQVREEVPGQAEFFRHPSVGGWPFSTVEHGWPITDCTAEGMKTVLLLHENTISETEVKVTDERLMQAADLVLSFQNKDGGWASYEMTRAPGWLELMNPSEIFGNIMIDHSYTECSSACIQALALFQKKFPAYRTTHISKAIEKGIAFILNEQRTDGSWYGSWAVCFTYGTWFGIEALSSVAETPQIRQAIDKACAFLVSKQNDDGGWGEDFESCLKKKYVPAVTSQLINTSWALLALMAAGYKNEALIEKGIRLLEARQMSNGDFPQEQISGVFNHSCGITYTSYRNVFPIWALGRFSSYARG